MHIRFELTEILFVLSCVMFVTGISNIGWTFFALAILSGIVRFGMNQAEKLESNKQKEKLEEDLKSLLKNPPNFESNSKGYPKIVH